MAYHYSCLYRPPGHATVPEGWTLLERGKMDAQLGTFRRRVDLIAGSTPFGLIAYAEPLENPERWDLELTPPPA